MKNLLFEIKLNSPVKHSTGISIGTLIENSLRTTFPEKDIKICQRVVQDLLEINKKFEANNNHFLEIKLNAEGSKNIVNYKSIIPSSEADKIKDQLDTINKAIPDSAKLKSMFKAKLRSGVIAGNNAAKYPDLNIIDLGRELQNKIQYSFIQTDSVNSMLLIEVIV